MAADIQEHVKLTVQKAVEAAFGNRAVVDRGEIVKSFLGQGPSRATLFRWVAAELRARPPAEKFSDTRLWKLVDDPLDAEGLARITGPSGEGLVNALENCMKAARDAMAHSRHPDGSVRLAKSLLAGSEHMRRIVETAARVHATVVDSQKVENYFRALLRALEHRDKSLAAEVLADLEGVQQRFRNGET